MTDYVCTTCGHLFDADGAAGDGMPCPLCNPMRWGSKVSSPAGRFAMNRFHGPHNLPHPAGVCTAVTPPQGPVLDALGVPDTGAGLRLCPNDSTSDDELCDSHAGRAREGAQLDLFSGLFD